MQESDINNSAKVDREVKLANIRLSYLVDLGQQVAAFDVWLDAGDFGAVAKNAHRIKGTAGTYRLADIAESMAEIEQLAAAENGTGIASKLKHVLELLAAQTRRADEAYQRLTGDRPQEEPNG